MQAWVKAVRVKFLTASIVAVTAGLSISVKRTGLFDPITATATYLGVIALHASVDLLNDYFDYKSGIDLVTTRTPLSGGTGVLPEGLLSPKSVYKAGLFSLGLGSLIGIYLAITKGIIILVILAFAAVSVYFYSTKLVNWGLGEFFLALKGTLIVLGTYFVQTRTLAFEALYVGVILGTLSASVLFINQFPDHDADKSKGRYNLVVRLGRAQAAKLHWLFHLLAYVLIISGAALGIIPVLSLLALATIPMTIKVASRIRQNYDKPMQLVPYMAATSKAARLIGILVIIAYITPFTT